MLPEICTTDSAHSSTAVRSHAASQSVTRTVQRAVVNCYKGLGLVNEVFHEETLKRLGGNLGVGHVRYSTTGSSTIENTQPLVLKYFKGTLCLAHNGNLVNAFEMRRQLEETGAIFQTTMDSEVIAFHIARERLAAPTAEEAIKRTAAKHAALMP